MGLPDGTRQAASNAVAALGNWISAHRGTGGALTGALEANGAGYQRQQTTWTPGTTGTNAGTTVALTLTPAALGYTEGGVWSAQTGGTFVASAPFIGGTVYISGTSAIISVAPTVREFPVYRVTTDYEVDAVGQNRMRILDTDGTPVVRAGRGPNGGWLVVAEGVTNTTAPTRRAAIGEMMDQLFRVLNTSFSTLVPYGIAELP